MTKQFGPLHLLRLLLLRLLLRLLLQQALLLLLVLLFLLIRRVSLHCLSGEYELASRGPAQGHSFGMGPLLRVGMQIGPHRTPTRFFAWWKVPRLAP